MSETEEGDDNWGLPVTNVRINLLDRSVELESLDGTVATLRFPAFGTIYFQGKPPADEGAPPEPEDGEKPKTVVLTGRLKAKPKEGRADRSGNPTAYARFSAHVEGEREAHDYIATFHRHTAAVALGLPSSAKITVEGYPHPSSSSNRLDSFSVINILNRPNKT